MHYVYLLKSIKKKFLYVGSTDDLRKRFQQHNARQEFATKAYAPFKLVYYEAYRSKRDALDRERKLKHHGSVIGHLKRRVKFSLLEE
jgi:putative endonuclease